MDNYVAFPGLGIDRIPLSETLVEFPLFGMTVNIRWYGFLIAMGFALALIYAFRQAPKVGINRDRMLDVVLVTAVVAVLCARLYYVFFSDHVADYLAHPEKIFAIWDGGLAIYGGIIAAFLMGALMCRWRKVNTFALFDLAVVGFAIGQGIGRWGNFFNQEAYGVNTDLPWGMVGNQIVGEPVHGMPVHPTFLYESLWCLLGALLLHVMFKKLYYFHGQLFGAYLIWYGVERLFVEGLRTDSLFIPGTPIRVSQAVSLLAIAGGAVFLFFMFRRAKKAGLTRVAFVTAAESEEEAPEEAKPTITLQEETVEEISTEETISEETTEEDDEHGKDH